MQPPLVLDASVSGAETVDCILEGRLDRADLRGHVLGAVMLDPVVHHAAIDAAHQHVP
ncbi:hypothetical protein PybrP1_006284 [[Pythium] brassicae (nom. inval.)]|nr:hypothetical protein PybrP1_006284 [[Pythium] brassicae (nom. inval.)]